MKNLLILIIAAGLVLFTSCSEPQPRDVAEKAVQCTQSRDYASLIDLMVPAEAQNEKDKAMLIALMEEKGNYQLDKRGGLKSYKIGEQEINKKKGKASVEVEYFYGNGTTHKEVLRFRKDNNKWYLSL